MQLLKVNAITVSNLKSKSKLNHWSTFKFVMGIITPTNKITPNHLIV